VHARLIGGPADQQKKYDVDDPPPPRGFFLRRGQQFGPEAHRYRFRRTENDPDGTPVAVYDYVDRVPDN
jgi:hypothetical protein